MDMREKLQECIENMTDSELFEVWNGYCLNNHYDDDLLISMADFDERLEGESPSEIIGLITDNDFNVNDDYFKHTIYGLESFNTVSDAVYIDDLINYIIRTEESFNNSDIQDILSEEEETL